MTFVMAQLVQLILLYITFVKTEWFVLLILIFEVVFTVCCMIHIWKCSSLITIKNSCIIANFSQIYMAFCELPVAFDDGFWEQYENL